MHQESRPPCNVCGEAAVYLERTTGQTFCESHFIQRFEDNVRRTILADELLSHNEFVAVALSGGKDSSALLFFLNKICRKQSAGIIAITVDEGIPGYRDETIAAARDLAEKLGVSHRVVSFLEKYGHTLEDLLAGNEERSCTVCGVLRRKLLQDTAGEVGATALATGHCLDDEVQSMLMNYLRGDMARISRDGSEREDIGLVRRIKPFKRVTEKEVTLYGMIHGFWRDLPECRYAGYALRSDIRKLVGALEKESPGSMQRIAEGYENVRAFLQKKPASDFSRCRACGSPCSGSICQACRILGSLVKENSHRLD